MVYYEGAKKKLKLKEGTWLTGREWRVHKNHFTSVTRLMNRHKSIYLNECTFLPFLLLFFPSALSLLDFILQMPRQSSSLRLTWDAIILCKELSQDDIIMFLGLIHLRCGSTISTLLESVSNVSVVA